MYLVRGNNHSDGDLIGFILWEPLLTQVLLIQRPDHCKCMEYLVHCLTNKVSLAQYGAIGGQLLWHCSILLQTCETINGRVTECWSIGAGRVAPSPFPVRKCRGGITSLAFGDGWDEKYQLMNWDDLYKIYKLLLESVDSMSNASEIDIFYIHPER